MTPANLFKQQVLAWFDDHGRKDLPWQQNPSAYSIWISEIMLQQTQVTTVIPYYLKFLQRFPTIKKLAAASVDEVLAYWSGLGYYSRARNLHKAAEQILTLHAGQFPRDTHALQQLPGIGRSTAGAILSLAFNQPHPILDGNVKRVLARYYAIAGPVLQKDIQASLWQKAQALACEHRAGDFTQAMMDLGSLICKRSQPACNDCPLNQSCQAHLENRVAEFPHKRKKALIPQKQRYFLMLRNTQGSFLLEKRPPVGIWGGLWSFPEIEKQADIKKYVKQELNGNINQVEYWPMFRHTFTHFHLDIIPVLGIANQNLKLVNKDSGNKQWYSLAAMKKLGLSTPMMSLIKQLKQHNANDKAFAT